MDWIFDLIGGALKPYVGGLFAGLAGLIALFFAKRAGAKEEQQKGEIATRKEIGDAYKDREVVDARVAAADDTERQRLRNKWGRKSEQPPA